MLKQKKRSLFSYIFGSYLIMAVAMLFFFMGGFLVTDITGELERNNYKYYYGKMDQKRNEIEHALLHEWSSVNAIEPLKELILSKVTYEEHPGVDLEIANELIHVIGAMDATGAMVVLDLNHDEGSSIFIRNSNIKSGVPNMDNFNMVVGELSLSKEMGIGLSDRWRRSFVNGDPDNKQLLRYVVSRFEKTRESYFWYKFKCGNQYSMMLFTPVRVYGEVVALIGLEINENFLTYFLNYVELSAAKKSAYAIAKYNPVYNTYYNEFINGPHVTGRLPNIPLHLKRIENVNFVTYSGANYIAYSVGDYVCIVMPLRISEFRNDWVLISYIPRDEFYVHSSFMLELFQQSALVTILLSVGLAFVISKVMTSPVSAVVDYTEKRTELKSVGIREYDRIMELVERISEGVEESNSRLDFVLNLLGTSMVVMKHDLSLGLVYRYGVGGETLNRVFGDESQWPKPAPDFGKLVDSVYSMVDRVDYQSDSVSDYKILPIPLDGETYYFKSVIQIRTDFIYYFMLDFTEEIAIEEQAAYDLDYDRATGLLNRDAFKRVLSGYFEDNFETKGALVMWAIEDLDDVNQIYGYECGDRYINAVGRVLSGMTASGAFVSKYAVDKFVTFIPFEQMREKVVSVINEYTMKISMERVSVTEDNDIGIKLVKGIAWYPSDSSDILQLCKFAEFAYKSSGKRSYNTNHQFSASAYEVQMTAASVKDRFDHLIERKEVDFAFQPVIDIEEMRIIGYEALMRPTSKNTVYVDDVLKMAFSYHRLGDLETLTVQQAFKKIKKMIDRFGDKLVFINTIRDIQVSKRLIGSLFDEELDRRIVIDLSEVEKLEREALRKKADWAHDNGFQLCLDRFGLWFSSESLMDVVRPEYVKLSMEIVRNIDKEPKKQKTLSQIMDMCGGDTKLIAVGVETLEELRYLKSAGVKYVQGFLLGEPKFEVLDYLEDDIIELLRFV